MASIEGDSWKLRVDRSGEPKREPGPIQLQRYRGTPVFSGIPTFMGLPICLTPEDLKAGKVDWPNAAAVADVHGAANVGVIHLDTHADCSNQYFGHLVTHGTPIRRLIDEEHIPARNFVQVGLHSFVVPDNELLAWMRQQGMRSHHMAEINRIGFDAVLEKAIAEALDGPKFIYISLDIDVLDPAFAPGTGTPEPGGLTPRELLPAIRRLCHETPVVGFEVVEVAPHLDPGYTTAMYARRAILEALTGIAQRKLGITEKNYLDPVMAGTVPFAAPGGSS